MFSPARRFHEEVPFHRDPDRLDPQAGRRRRAGQGQDICRQAGISVPTYYKWKSKYGGLEASELRRVKDLEAENARLKRMYAELALDNAAMKDLIAKKL